MFFSSITVSIGCTSLFLAITRAGKKDLHVHTHTTGDVALTNISRETNHFHDFSVVAKKKVLRLSSASVCS